ncbi:MAG TPA: hypothetical protein VFI90_19160 [Rubrobacter sp.]|nr:hypothetical protein [Rubrobacter sp.]
MNKGSSGRISEEDTLGDGGHSSWLLPYFSEAGHAFHFALEGDIPCPVHTFSPDYEHTLAM